MNIRKLMGGSKGGVSYLGYPRYSALISIHTHTHTYTNEKKNVNKLILYIVNDRCMSVHINHSMHTLDRSQAMDFQMRNFDGNIYVNADECR